MLLHTNRKKGARKATLVSLLLFVALFTTLFLPAGAAAETQDIGSYHWPVGPELSAEGAILIEAETGAVLFEKNSTEALYPASTTKLMTALLALENAAMGETVTVSHNAVYDIDTDSSRIWVDVGEELTMEESLYALMLPSANDMAYAIAEHIAGSKDAFANMMNERALELGCVNTSFRNPHGLDEDGHLTCAADLARIMRAAIKSPTFLKISGSRNYEIKPTNLCAESRWILNTHLMIRNSYPYEGVIAGKTGHTDLAGANLVTCAKRGSMTLIAVILKAPDDTALYDETAALLNYGFNNFTTYSISDEQLSLDSTFPPLFHSEDSVRFLNNNIVDTEAGCVVLPLTASLSDTKKSVALTQLTSFAQGKNMIGKVSYTYGNHTVGAANVVFYNEGDAFTLNTSLTSTPAPNPEEASGTPIPGDASESKLTPGTTGQETPGQDTTEGTPKKDRKPLIIGIVLGCICLFVGMYLIFVELPYRRKRAAYLAKRRNNRR